MTEDRSDIPDSPEAIRADRDRTRAELGETVAELTDKVDVPARAEAKLHDTAEAARHKAAAIGHQAVDAADRARTRAGQLVDNATPSLSEPMQDVGKQAAESVRRNRVPVAVVAAGSAAVITWILLRRRRA